MKVSRQARNKRDANRIAAMMRRHKIASVEIVDETGGYLVKADGVHGLQFCRFVIEEARYESKRGIMTPEAASEATKMNKYR